MGHIEGKVDYMNMDIIEKIDNYEPPALEDEREYSGLDENFALSVIGNLA